MISLPRRAGVATRQGACRHREDPVGLPRSRPRRARVPARTCTYIRRRDGTILQRVNEAPRGAIPPAARAREGFSVTECCNASKRAVAQRQPLTALTALLPRFRLTAEGAAHFDGDRAQLAFGDRPGQRIAHAIADPVESAPVAVAEQAERGFVARNAGDVQRKARAILVLVHELRGRSRFTRQQ